MRPFKLSVLHCGCVRVWIGAVRKWVSCHLHVWVSSAQVCIARNNCPSVCDGHHVYMFHHRLHMWPFIFKYVIKFLKDTYDAHLLLTLVQVTHRLTLLFHEKSKYTQTSLYSQPLLKQSELPHVRKVLKNKDGHQVLWEGAMSNWQEVFSPSVPSVTSQGADFWKGVLGHTLPE